MTSPFIVHKTDDRKDTSAQQGTDHPHAKQDNEEHKDSQVDLADAVTKQTSLSEKNKASKTSETTNAKPENAFRQKNSRQRVINNLWIYFVLLPLCTIIAIFTIELYLAGESSLIFPARVALMAAGIMAFIYVLMGALSLYRQHEGDQKLLRELFDGSPSARLVTDIRDQAVYQNARFMTLCQRYDLKSQGLDALVELFGQEKSIQADLQKLIENAKKGQGGHVELRLWEAANEDENAKSTSVDASQNHDDEGEWYQIDAQPVAGRAGYIQWRVEDVTQRHCIETAVREEREKLLDFMDNAPVGFFSVNEEGRFSFANETLARWLGEPVDNLVEQARLHSFMEKPTAKGQPYDIVDDGGAKQSAEILMKGADGKKFLASISQSVVHEEEDKVRTRGVVHDLTSERAMHQALKDSEDRFQRFFEEAPLGIALLDQHGVISDCNSSFARMLDLTVKALEGRSFDTLIDVQNRQTVSRAIATIDEGQRLMSPVEFKLGTDKKDVYVQMFARRFHGKNLVLHFIDLTDQKTLEAQFVQSQKMQAIGQLAGGVAHDFNNLLTAMIGFCDLLILRHKAGDPSFNDIMQIKQNANRAANLVRQLLAFSRQQTLQAKVLDITETLTELSHLLYRLLGVGIELDVIHDAGLGLVKVDEGQLEQVMINLAVNARDAMEGQGSLAIRTYPYKNPNPIKRGADTMPVGDWVVIEVKDTGSGIPKDIIERIFEPFFTTKEIGSGTGLGLSTVYGIIRQTGGFVHVESVIGQGTTFLIYLPEHEVDEADVKIEAVKEIMEEKDLTGTATILLVEDEDAVRGFAVRALKNKGYEVLEAANAEDALDLIQNDAPDLDLMITDVIMPEKDGPTLAREVLADQPNLPVIFVSGYTEDRFKDEFEGYNVSFLPKPFTLKQLAEKVKDTLDDRDAKSS